MNSLKFNFIFFVMLLRDVAFGRLGDISFSVCWMSNNEALERQNGDIWLNDTSLISITKEGKVTSLTVHPDVENKLTLEFGDLTHMWTFTIMLSKRFNKIQGVPRPRSDPTNATKVFLDSLSPSEVFACENNTAFFHQDEDFFLATGHTMRFPVKLESRSTSMLLFSWMGNSQAVNNSHTVTMYRTDSNSHIPFGVDSTTSNQYDFISLDSCSLYLACVEIADTHSFTCLSAVTEPDIPKDFEVTSWNSSSISLSWDCPDNLRYSLFLLTIYYLNGSDHITEEVLLRFKEDTLVYTLLDLEPCARVRFGLQTVCQSGMELSYSEMVPNNGNSVHSSIWGLCQTPFSPDNYALRWEVSNASSISKFRVYHEGVLQGTTLLTNYTVGGLSECRQYQAKVEALCGDDVLMNAKTITALTGPVGMSELSFHSNDSTTLWTPTTTQLAMAYVYEVSLKNGTIIHNRSLTDAQLGLSGLDEGKSYTMDIWEQCDGEWPFEDAQPCVEADNSSSTFFGTAGPVQELVMDFVVSDMRLTMVVPWSLPEDLQDDMSEIQRKIAKIFKDKMQELLKDYDHPARIELVTIRPAEEPDKTEIVFWSFDALITEENVSLPVEDQLDYIDSQNATHISVRDGIIYWDGPDLCLSLKYTSCPRNSLCVNTLGSFTCVCRHGYYDVSSVTERQVTSQPICNEKGLFSQCLDKLMTGGIAKPYLMSHIGGKVDVKLNDGRCNVEQSAMLFYFRTTRKSSECGTERRVNKTHFEYQNTLSVTLTKEETISRRDLKVVWKCVYPRHYVRNTHVSMDMEWLSALSLVQFNSSLQLALSMTLFTDESFNSSYTDVISLDRDDILYFEVALHTNNSFASFVLLQVESCWATESSDPQDTVQGVFLHEGCPIDHTFYWLSVNGMEQKSRFSIEMFTMPKGLPLYIHCMANICGHDKDCTKNCSSQQRTKRSESQPDRRGKRAAVVSAGPVVVNTRVPTSYWAEHMTMILIVAGSMGVLGITILSVSATKAIMSYYEQLQLQ
ncbi:uncharacterized protein LOC131455897 isoform X1 [Solea solea]|uniref:uncharacterized protein LOC131455897 isoform X1 n=1 Tax=Solea solea TaxID=90069 RepID=UPI00272B4276|nr:uncharacterized protein LOC131455897 isoform X1 [Solea solea]